MAFKIPFLKNFRRGFATNSSSSHSFVYLKEPVAHANADGDVTGEEFGWNDFKLETIKEKLFYVLAGLIGGGWSAPTKGELEDAYEEYGDDFPELSKDDFAEALQTSVDHDSGNLISASEARDPHVVIFGGNDNGGESNERAKVVRAGLVDWERTEMSWDDEDNIREDDVEGQKILEKRNERWNR